MAESPSITDQTIAQAINKIVDEGDLNALTFNMIFKTLETQFNTKLEERKAFIKSQVLLIIRKKQEENEKAEREKEKAEEEEEKEESEEEEDESSDEEPKKRKSDEKPKLNEEELRAFGLSEKEIEAQRIMMEAYQTGGTRTRVTRSGAAPAKSKRSSSSEKSKKTTKKKKKSESSDEDEDDEKEKKKTPKKKKGFSARTYVLSDALSEFLGKNMIPRTEVVSDLHKYFKEHNLQDPKDGRRILFDEKLQEVFKCKTTDYFKLNKLLSSHVKPADQVV